MTCNKNCFFWLELHWTPESRPPLTLLHRWQLSDFSLSTGQQCNHCQYSMYLDCSLLWYIEGWWCVDTKSDNWFWVAVGLKTIRQGWSVGLLWSTLSWLRWRERQESKNTEPTRIFDMHRAQWNATGAWMCISSQQSAHRTAVTSAEAHGDRLWDETLLAAAECILNCY